MARISKYELDVNITENDLLIGTDGDSGLETKNFSLTGVADFIIDTLINPDASDFHVPVFNSNGTRLTDSIMHQDSSPSNGVAGTLLTVDGNFSIVGNTTLGTTVSDTTTVPSTLKLRGKLLDKDDVTGIANQVLMSNADGYVFWGPEVGEGYVTGQGTLYTLPLWTPDTGTLGDSILSQDGQATQVTVGGKAIVEGDLNVGGEAVVDSDLSVGGEATIEGDLSVEANTLLQGNVEVNGTAKLDSTTQDNTQDKVLVVDANTNIVKYRSALTISPELGWDTVAYADGNTNWIVDKYNGYMEIPFGVIPPAKREVRPAGLTTGEEGYFVFVANSEDIPADFLDFTSINSGNINRVRTTWSGSGTRTYIPNNQNSGKWVTGTVVKFHYIVREEGGVATIFWDACCEIEALNDCPVILSPSVSHTINEDQTFSGGLPATDGDGPSALQWSIVSQPDSGSVSLNAATGNYTYTPNSNYFGNDTFTWQVFDGGCYSEVGRISMTINEVVEFPAFKISGGLGNNCGTEDAAPLFQGTAGQPYKWEGNYCDPDHAAADVTITTFYDVGGTWVAGLPANWAFAKDDVSGVAVDYRFTLESSNVASGLTRIKLEIEDAGGNVGTPYILEIGAAFDTLTKTEILLDYSGSAANTTGGDWIYPGVTYDNIWDGKKFENLSTDTYNGHTSEDADVATSVSPSGGTFAALYPSATFTIRKITDAAPLEFYYTLELDNGPIAPTSNNIDVGQTISFDATTLNSAFGKTGSTGSLIWTLEVEDILRASLATGNITNISPCVTGTGHSCNDGGMALIAWGYDTSGAYHVFLLRRFDIANDQGLPRQHQRTAGSQFFASKSWDPPYAYISTPADVDGQCTTPQNTSTWWQRGGLGWQLDETDVDETNAGAIWDKDNTLSNLPNQSGANQNNYSYIPAVQLANYSAANNSTSGIYRMDSSTAATIASTITSGQINFMVVGLGFANGPQPPTNGTPATCDPTKEYQAWLHGDACQMRIFTENATRTNQIEIKDGANSFQAGDGKYVEIDVYATPGSNATIGQF